MISKYKAFLIVSALSIMAGFSSGYYFKGLQHDSSELKGLKAAEIVAFESYDLSSAITALNADKKDAIEIVYQEKVKEIVKYVPATSHEKTCTTDSGVTVSRVLTRDAVGVLNNELSDSVQPASGSNEEGSALTEVGLRELSEHILRIQKQYEDLAADHEALVDYDNWYKEKTRPN